MTLAATVERQAEWSRVGYSTWCKKGGIQFILAELGPSCVRVSLVPARHFFLKVGNQALHLIADSRSQKSYELEFQSPMHLRVSSRTFFSRGEKPDGSSSHQ